MINGMQRGGQSTEELVMDRTGRGKEEGTAAEDSQISGSCTWKDINLNT